LILYYIRNFLKRELLISFKALEHLSCALPTMDSSTRDEKGLGHNVATKPDLESDREEIGKTGPRWSKRQIIATVSLSILWVGEFTPHPLPVSAHSLSRLTSSFVLHWRHTFLLDSRPWWRRVDFFDLDPFL
jgi:hypothetical protein